MRLLFAWGTPRGYEPLITAQHSRLENPRVGGSIPPLCTILSTVDRLIFVWAYRLRPSVLEAICIVQPETVVRWHRAGLRLDWRRKSRSRGGRPPSQNWKTFLRNHSVGIAAMDLLVVPTSGSGFSMRL
jgi:hypothetical protein